MRFLHFSTSDGPGGAGKAAYRLHAALREAGGSSRMLVRERLTCDPDVQAVPVNPLVAQLRRLQKHLPLASPGRTRFTFNHDLEQGVRLSAALRGQRGPFDAICLHWVSNFLTSRGIRRIYEQYASPLLWVIMDQEPMTGGCHYSFGCDGYTRQCGNCPLVARPAPDDPSHLVFTRKGRHLGDLPITFIAPTFWAEARLRQSALFGSCRVERIALPIDTTIFRPRPTGEARDALRIPRDRHVVFFGSSYLHEPRKGGPELIEALKRLRGALSSPHLPADRILVVMAGNHGDELRRSVPFGVHDLGYLSDEATLATAYQAADLFVCPSIEDAGPMMIPEAMLCGTPVVAFEMGGAPDLVVTGETGYLARLGDAADLARGIEELLVCPDRAGLGQTAAARARKLHEPAIVANLYMCLVAELSASSRAPAQRHIAA
jgi:glycosyltransferase involved in cell wall biosynthesis